MGPGRQNGWFKRKKREKVDFLEVESSRFVPPCLVSSLRNNFVPRIWKNVTLHLTPYNTRRLFACSDCDFWPRQCFDFCVHSVQSTAEIYSQLKRSSFTKENWPNGAIFSAPSLCKRRRVWKAVQELNLNLPQPPNRVCLFDYSLQLFIRKISPMENAWALIWIYF